LAFSWSVGILQDVDVCGDAVMRVLQLCVVSRVLDGVLDVVALAMEQKMAKSKQAENDLHLNK
jgi:hypothetical protein